MRDENVARINCNAINCILLLNTKNKVKINTQQQTQNIIAKRLIDSENPHLKFGVKYLFKILFEQQVT